MLQPVVAVAAMQWPDVAPGCSTGLLEMMLRGQGVLVEDERLNAGSLLLRLLLMLMLMCASNAILQPCCYCQHLTRCC
jgi:hypothetical protein